MLFPRTQEYAKNPNAEAKIRCTQCKHVHALPQYLQERPLKSPYEEVVEGLLVCPDCGYTTHSYYMPENTRFQQSLLEKSLREWNEKRTPASYKEYSRRLKNFQASFDIAQQRFGKLFGTTKKEKVSEPETG